MTKEKHGKGKKGGFWPSGEEIRRHRAVFAVYLVLRLFVVAALVVSVLRGNYENVFICVLVLFLFLLPALAKRALKIELPSTLEIIILLFIFAAEIMGELQCYFIQYAHWDTLLHVTNGFLCAAFGYSLADLLNRETRFRIQLPPFFLVVVAFCFSMTIGVLWEFFEFGIDVLFYKDMQKDTVVAHIASTLLDPTRRNVSIVIPNITDVAVNGASLGLGGYLDIGLYDTMEDLFVNFIGAAIFSALGYIDAKTGSRFVSRFVPRVRGAGKDGAEPGPGDIDNASD